MVRVFPFGGVGKGKLKLWQMRSVIPFNLSISAAETFAKPLERRRSCSPSAAECRNAEFRMQNAEICISLLRVQTRALSHLKVQPAGQEQRGGQVAGQTHFK